MRCLHTLLALNAPTWEDDPTPHRLMGRTRACLLCSKKSTKKRPPLVASLRQRRLYVRNAHLLYICSTGLASETPNKKKKSVICCDRQRDRKARRQRLVPATPHHHHHPSRCYASCPCHATHPPTCFFARRPNPTPKLASARTQHLSAQEFLRRPPRPWSLVGHME